MHEGDPARALHIVDKGRVLVRQSLPSGHEAIVNILRPGQLVGELACLRPDALRCATVIAIGPVETMQVDGVLLHDLRRRIPAVDDFLVASLADSIALLTARLSEAYYEPVAARVTGRLRDLAIAFDDGLRPIAVPLTQEDLASMAGTTRTRANLALAPLEGRGVITRTRGKLLVHDLAGLAR
jgi:CRP/FNR family transcriptional regulator, cyclic AMP receptor protein